MSEVLEDLSTSALSNAVKSNLYAFFQYLGHAKQTELFTSSALVRWHTQTAHPWFNGVLSTQPAAETAQETIQTTIAYFRSRAVANFTWWLAPTLTRSDWESHLIPYGFHYDGNTPGLAIDLHELNRMTTVIPDLTITPVLDIEMLRIWTTTFIQGYELPSAFEHSLFDLMAGIGLAWPVRNYLGWLNGKPVATANLFLAAGVAGVQFIATLPEARRQGIGAAMTLAPLHEAQQVGYRIGILQSSTLGLKVYQRLSFRQVCQIEHFYWTHEAG